MTKRSFLLASILSLTPLAAGCPGEEMEACDRDGVWNLTTTYGAGDCGLVGTTPDVITYVNWTAAHEQPEVSTVSAQTYVATELNQCGFDAVFTSTFVVEGILHTTLGSFSVLRDDNYAAHGAFYIEITDEFGATCSQSGTVTGTFTPID